MASYSKRMMEEAALWIACNPEGDLSVIKIPGYGKNSEREKSNIEEDRRLLRIEQAAKSEPAVALAMMPKIEQIRALHAERDRRNAEIDDAEVKIALAMNSNEATSPFHGKLATVHGEPTNVQLGRWFLAWGRSGHNVFDLSADFTAATLLTDPRELDIGEVKLPFPGLLMIIPDGFAVGSDGRSYTKIHITEISSLDRTLLATSNSIAEVLQEFPEVSHATLMEQVGKLAKAKPAAPPRSLVAPVAPPPPGDVLHIYATDGVNALSTTIEREGLTWGSFETLPEHVDDATDRQVSQTIRQIVFGALAYATVVERSVEPRDTEPRKRKGTSTAAAPKHWDIGRTIRLDPRLVRAARSGSREIALRLKHRHIVIGHYRNQAHGIRFAERKRIYISCHWKGREDGAKLVHTYKLEEPSSS